MKKSLLTFFLFAFVYANLQAQWPSNRNSPINVASSSQSELVQQTISDGLGGVYLIWQRTITPGGGYDIYAAHYSSEGMFIFNTPVYSSPNPSDSEWLAGAVLDETNGIIIVWSDQRTNPNCLGGCAKEYYGQRISFDGVKEWPQDGLLLVGGLADPSHTQMGQAQVLKGDAEDFYLVWEERGICPPCNDGGCPCPNTTNRIMAQHYDQDGIDLWNESKIVYSSVGISQYFNFDAKYNADADRIFIVWQDSRANTHWYFLAGNTYSGAIENYDLYAQAISGSNGNQLWDVNGVMVNNVVDMSLNYDRLPNPKIAFDQTGMVVTWVDYRVEGQKSIYGTRLSKTSGVRFGSWPAEGKQLSSYLLEDIYYAPQYQIEYPVYYDLKSLPGNTYLLAYPGEVNQLYAQKFTTSGSFQWGTGTIISDDDSQFNGHPQIIENGNEPIVAWKKTGLVVQGSPPSTSYLYNSTFFGQKLSLNGEALWQTPVQVTNLINEQVHFIITGDGNGGFFTGWSQYGFGAYNFDVKLNSVSSSGKFKGGLTLTIDSHSGAKGQTVSIPISVQDFEDVLTLQASLQWDPSIVSFVEVADFGLTGLDQNSFGLTNTATGSLSFSWDDITAEGQQLDQHAVLFTVKFQLIGNPGDETDLLITDQPVAIEAYYETGFEQAGVKINHGYILIDSYQLNLSAYYLQGNQLGQAKNGIVGVDFYIDNDLYGTSNQAGEVGIQTLPNEDGTIQILAPLKSDLDKAGVDVADILMARAHLLGNIIFDSPYKMFAADVDGNGVISTIDIAQIRAYILAKQNSFNGKSWIFVNDYQFYDANQKYDISINPFTYLDHLALDYQQLDINELLTPGAIKFVGVKLGDVDASWAEEDGARTNTSSVELTAVYNQTLTLGEEFEVLFQSPAINDLAGMQFTLQWNPEIWQYQNIEANDLALIMNEDRVNEGYLSLLWYSNDATQSISFEEGTLLFKMKFLPLALNGTIEMNSDMTSSKAYTKNLSRYDLSLNNVVLEDAANEAGVYPNPVQDKLSVKFTTTQESMVKFMIINSAGGTAMEEVINFSKGFHTYDINTENLADGIYLLTLDNGEKRMKTVRIVKH